MKWSRLIQANSCTYDCEVVFFCDCDFVRGSFQPSGGWEIMESCMKYTHPVSHFCKHLCLLLKKCAEKWSVCTRIPRRDEQNVVFTQPFTQTRVSVRWSRRLWVGWIQSSSSTLRAFSTASSGRKKRLGTLEENSSSQNF